MKITDYGFACAPNLEELIKVMDEKLSAGWQPQGGPFVVRGLMVERYNRSDEQYVAQAIVKFER